MRWVSTKGASSATRVAVMLALITAGTQVDASDGAKKNRLQERMSALSQAFNTADVPTLKTLLAEHYSHTNNGAPPLNKSAWLASIEKRRADMDAGILEITDVETSEIEVHTRNNTAVGTGLYVMRGKRNDQDFGLKIRYTQVWEWDGEDWYRVAFHDTYEPLKD